MLASGMEALAGLGLLVLAGLVGLGVQARRIRLAERDIDALRADLSRRAFALEDALDKVQVEVPQDLQDQWTQTLTAWKAEVEASQADRQQMFERWEGLYEDIERKRRQTAASAQRAEAALAAAGAGNGARTVRQLGGRRFGH